LFVWYAQQRLGIGQAKWQRIRGELERSGYMFVSREHVEGRYRWQYHIFDHPQTAKQAKPAPIGDITIGGFSTDCKTTDCLVAAIKKQGKEIHPKEINNKNKTTHPAGAITQATPALVASESFNKAKSKNITPPLPSAKAKQKNNPDDELADFVDFKEKLHVLDAFNKWLDGLPDRDKGKYRFNTHIYPSFFDIYLGAGLEGVADACEQAAANGYRSLAFCNGGEPGVIK
jgi:hypothetical protein